MAASNKQEGRVLLPNHVVPVKYDIHLTPNLVDFTFTGECQITLKVTDTIPNDLNKSLTLHAKELCFANAHYETEGEQESVKAEEITVNLKATTVKLTFAKEFVPGSTITLFIQYNGFLNNQMAGFYRSSYTDVEGNSKIMASTQFESLDARRCFPCIDEPAVKAKFGVALTVDSYLDVLSNMPESESVRISKDKKKIIFQDTPIMSTYLLAICVGEFDSVQSITKHGVSVTVYTPPGKSSSGMFALDAATKCLDLYDDFFQVKFPLPKLDMIAIPEFAAGAMEVRKLLIMADMRLMRKQNWGLVTYREVDLLIDPVTASSKQKQRVLTVVTHELAHQWFGNLVTMTWWDDLWLNEGFASWAENYAADKLRPDYCMWEQFTTGSLSTAMRLDALKSSHPIQVPIHHAEEVEQVFDAISYCKGASVVRMIRAVLGTKFFQTGLSKYMEKYAYGNTETVDLWGAWEDVSGMPVKELMATWTEQMGFPLVKVVGEDWQADKVVLQLEQSWFLSDGSELDADGAAKAWTIPIMSCTESGTQSDMTLMREKNASITISLSGNESWVKLNAGQEVPMRVLCSSEMLRRMAPAIKSKNMSSIDRASLLNDMYALVKAQHAPPSELIKLLGNYVDEDDLIVWEGIAGCLLGIDSIVSEQKEISDAFHIFAKKMVVGLVHKVGWDEKPSDGHLETLLRSVMLRLVGTFAFDDADVVKEATARFEAFKADPNDVKSLPSDMRSPVFRIVLKNGGAQEYADVKSYFYTAPNNAERLHSLGTLGHTNVLALKKATMDWSISGEVKLQDFFYAMGSVGSSGKEGREISWEYFKDNFQTIKTMIENASPSIMNACIVMCSGSFSSHAKADEIEAFFEANPLPSSSRRISQLLEGMRANAQLLDVIVASELTKPEFWGSL